MRRRVLVLLVVAALLAAGESAVRLADPLVFRDEAAVLSADAPGAWRWTHRVLTVQGWRDLPDGDTAQLVPGIAGIHVLRLSAPVAAELRFLAIEPPPEGCAPALARALPRRGAALLAGEPFTLLAMGDSVTHTGWYDRILARLLQRATGNRRIAVVNRSYPGRSVDASVRAFAADTAVRPDLACIMYGLNDQGAWASLDGFVEQYAWLTGQLRERCGADIVLLQPTPDPTPPDDGLRTLAYAHALRAVAARAGVPLAETFAALWQVRGEALPSALASLQPLYPQRYDRQLSSMLEGGSADTIHPNALGHHALAQAVLAALLGGAAPEALRCEAASAWRAEGLVSTLRLRNHGGERIAGRLELRPPPAAQLAVRGGLDYDLAPGAVMSVEVAWPEVRGVDDLFRHPYDRYIAAAVPLLPVLDWRAGACRVHAVEAPIRPDGGFARGRQVCATAEARVRLHTPEGVRELVERWDADSAVGRRRLRAEVGGVPVAAELAWVRMAAARSGEIVPDGELGEWGDALWSPLGEACQARWVTGPADLRASPAEFRPQWAVRAGRDAIHLALRIVGDPTRDRFTLFCDPRVAELLGTAGPYWWIAGSWRPDGVLRIERGETSPAVPLADGRWRATADGATAECSIPYAVLGATGWPAGGDLGASLWWTHVGPAGTTQLQWSEDGHPWNTRWYGVVRRDPAGPLPWVVRVR